jgi:hypothetical protein
MSADDAVAAVQSMLGVEQMHRAALPFREAGALAVQLGHDPARTGAEGQGLGMIAIAAEDDVVLLQRADDPGGDRLLADVHMKVPADLPPPERRLGRLFEAADEDHLPEDLGPFRRAGRIGHRGIAFFPCFRHSS